MPLSCRGRWNDRVLCVLVVGHVVTVSAAMHDPQLVREVSRLTKAFTAHAQSAERSGLAAGELHAKLLADEQAEDTRLRTLAAERKQKLAAANPTAVPPFYQRASLPAPDTSDDTDVPGVAPSGERLRGLLRNAARSFEIEQYLELVDAWDQVPQTKVWEFLSAAAPQSPNGDGVQAVDYDGFRDAVQRMRAHLHATYPDSSDTLCLLLTDDVDDADDSTASSSRPKSPPRPNELPIEAHFVPKLNAQLFASCPRSPDGFVEIGPIYETLMAQISLLKTAAELLMRDDDSDGYLTEEELESYAAALWPQLARMQRVDDNLTPYYACAVARRLMWALDSPKQGSAKRGLVQINALLQHSELRSWNASQMTPRSGDQSWYSGEVFMHLYRKFLTLDSRGTGMLLRSDFAAYKKGIPPVTADGLPKGVCPIASLFIDRYFEVTNTFAGEMDFKNFVDFTLNVEFLPGMCPRPRLFFDIFDLDGDGVLTPMDLHPFFADTRAKLFDAGLRDTVPVDCFVRELFDALAPRESLRCTREEFFACPSVGIVCGSLIDPLTFYAYDTRDSNVGEKQRQLYLYEQPVRR